MAETEEARLEASVRSEMRANGFDDSNLIVVCRRQSSLSVPSRGYAVEIMLAAIRKAGMNPSEWNVTIESPGFWNKTVVGG